MASSTYYRRQYDVCLRLAMLESDSERVLLLIRLAKDLRTKAQEAETETETDDTDGMLDAAARCAVREGDALGERLERH